MRLEKFFKNNCKKVCGNQIKVLSLKCKQIEIMTLELYTTLRNPINERVNKYSQILNSFEKNGSGMVEVTKEFKSAKDSYELAFNELRILNGGTSNKIKREFSKANRGY
tara:strand:+ start:273 stop:599 length:327 start_codon:yes stop_codon:yes gene_type:complete